MALLKAEHLAVGYEGQKVLRDLSFEVNAGDYLCIVGENGSGKSTLMKTLLRLLPPLEGEVVCGEGLRRNEIGYRPQQTQVQRDFPASVREVVLSGFEGRNGFRPFYSRAEKETALENLDRMGILSLKDKSYRELSGGQQQRVLLARAFCATRRILLLDEPVAGLDPRAAREMYDLIADLNRDGVAILMISHDREAVRYASHILHIGQTVFFGTREEYLKSEEGKNGLFGGEDAS